MHNFNNKNTRKFIGFAFIFGGIGYFIFSFYDYFRFPNYHEHPFIIGGLRHYPLEHFIPDWIYCLISIFIGSKILKSHNTPFHLANILFIELIISNYFWLWRTNYEVYEPYRFAGNIFLLVMGVIGLIYFEIINRIWAKPYIYNIIRYIIYLLIIFGIMLLFSFIFME